MRYVGMLLWQWRQHQLEEEEEEEEGLSITAARTDWIELHR